MKTKPIPAIIMLSAGLVACIAGILSRMEVVEFMKMLLLVLILFYVLGCVIQWIIGKYFIETKEEETTDGEASETEEGTASEDGEKEQSEETQK